MSRATTPRRGLSIAAGCALVGVFLSWLIVREQAPLSLVLDTHTLLGGVAHGLAIAVLVGGVALIAWGTLGGREPADGPRD